MKRNKESKYRMKAISYLHLNKQKQKEFDERCKKFKISYFDMYCIVVKKDFSIVLRIISNVVDDNFGEILSGDSGFFQINDDINDKKPCYLGVDFAKCNDWTGRIVLNEKENT